MNKYLIIIILVLILLIIRIIKLKKNKSKNRSLLNFKRKLISKGSDIEKIFSRNDEKTSSDPDININIGDYDNENTISRKSNIHRARLSKFKKSKLNGEIIFVDQDKKVFKYVNGKKIYLV